MTAPVPAVTSRAGGVVDIAAEPIAAHLAQAIRDAFRTNYAVETIDFDGARTFIGPYTSAAEATESAKDYENARPVAAPKIPWHPIEVARPDLEDLEKEG